MIKTVIVALVICLIEFIVIVSASPMAKPSLVLRFLPEDKVTYLTKCEGDWNKR